MSRPRQRSAALPPSRVAALAAFRACLRGGLDLQPALDAAIRKTAPDARDAGLATELVYGTLRLRGRLDALLDRLLDDPGRVPAKLRDILAIAAYELLFLDKVPDYASVDWAVSAARADCGQGLAGLCNAVLRKVAKLGDAAHDPEFYRQGAKDEAAFLARWHSCPEWIVRLWRAQMPQDRVQAALRAQGRAPALGMRLNPLYGGHENLRADLLARPGLLLDEGNCLAFAPGSITAAAIGPLLASGALSRQSAASQLAVLGLAPDEWPGPVWDACAGRGGKSLLLAEAGHAPALASDPSAARIAGLAAECRRLGLAPIPAVRALADQPPLPAWAGTILIDAPCSGLGVLSRRPDSKWKRTPRDCRELAVLQRRVLDVCWGLLRPGGAVAYLTCTLNRDENEKVVAELLSSHRDARLRIERAADPDSPLGEFFYAALISKT